MGRERCKYRYIGYNLARRGSDVNIDYSGNNLACGLQLFVLERKEPNVGDQASAVGMLVSEGQRCNCRVYRAQLVEYVRHSLERGGSVGAV